MDQHLSYTNHHHNIRHGSQFWKRFRSNLYKELANAWGVLVIVIMSVLGFFYFLFEFEIVGKVFWFIMTPVLIYGFGEYLTLLPTYIALLLTGLSFWYKKEVSIFLSLCAFFSFFIVFLI